MVRPTLRVPQIINIAAARDDKRHRNVVPWRGKRGDIAFHIAHGEVQNDALLGKNLFEVERTVVVVASAQHNVDAAGIAGQRGRDGVSLKNLPALSRPVWRNEVS